MYSLQQGGRKKEGRDQFFVFIVGRRTHFNVLTEGERKTLFSPLTLVGLDSFPPCAIHVVIQMERKGTNAHTPCLKNKQTQKCGQIKNVDGH